MAEKAVEKEAPIKSPAPPIAQTPPPTSANPQPVAPIDKSAEQLDQAAKDIEEVKTIEKGYIKQPEKYVLTVKVKKWGFFGVKGAQIIILQSDKQIDTAVTDDKGQAPFNLLPGEYIVKYGEKSLPINIKQHSTLKF
jgi:hypothetical protein